MTCSATPRGRRLMDRLCLMMLQLWLLLLLLLLYHLFIVKCLEKGKGNITMVLLLLLLLYMLLLMLILRVTCKEFVIICIARTSSTYDNFIAQTVWFPMLRCILFLLQSRSFGSRCSWFLLNCVSRCSLCCPCWWAKKQKRTWPLSIISLGSIVKEELIVRRVIDLAVWVSISF